MVAWVRWPISGADQGGFSDLVATDVAFVPEPTPGEPYPQSLQLDFGLDSSRPVPRVHPPFPGQLRFVPDLAGGQQPPTAPEVEIAVGASDGWPLVGTLVVQASHRRVLRRLQQAFAEQPLTPTIAWLSKVRLPEDFLFETLIDVLPRQTIMGSADDRFTPGHPDWHRVAIALFLRGAYAPVLPLPADVPADDVSETSPWPVLHGTGDARLTITLGRVGVAQDEVSPNAPGVRPHKGTLMEPLTFGDAADRSWHAFESGNPRFGSLPARVFLAGARNEIHDAEAGQPMADAALGTVPPHRLVRFTRTHGPIRNESVVFPRQTATFAATGQGEVHVRLPAHGLVWVPVPSPTATVTVSLAGSARLLAGHADAPWRREGSTDPVELTASEDHVIVRPPFRAFLFREPGHKSDLQRCTYMAIRRFARVLVDNRICGGYLHAPGPRARARARAQMNAAWGSAPASSSTFVKGGPPARPRPLLPAAIRLRKTLESFYPYPSWDAAQLGSAYAEGNALYYQWQSAYAKMFEETEAFLHHHTGDGGVEVGRLLAFAEVLEDPAFQATDFVLPGIRDPQAVANRRARLAQAIVGHDGQAILQFWAVSAEYDALREAAATMYDVRDPEKPDEVKAPVGHSLFYLGTPAGSAGTPPQQIVVVDHHGPSVLQIERTDSEASDVEVDEDDRPVRTGAIVGIRWTASLLPDVWLAGKLVDGLF